jgi:hypothetical protein
MNMQLHNISKEHADQFGSLLVQDQKGRMKPMNTLTSEVLRKISRKESFYGLNADQVFLAHDDYTLKNGHNNPSLK